MSLIFSLSRIYPRRLKYYTLGKMRTIFISLTSLFLWGQSVFGSMDLIHTDVRVAAFYPQGSLFREVYGNWQVDYQLEIGKIFLENYEAWGNFSWVPTSGHSSLGNYTSYNDFNISLGAKYIFRFTDRWKLYLGLGINGALVYVHNHDNYVKKYVHKNGVGGVAKLGFYFEPVDHFFIDVFADYLYQRIHFAHWQQVGGLKMGCGAGFCF